MSMSKRLEIPRDVDLVNNHDRNEKYQVVTSIMQPARPKEPIRVGLLYFDEQGASKAVSTSAPPSTSGITTDVSLQRHAAIKQKTAPNMLVV